jgi:ABC-type multidrug transport system fused ATPase/permease subunit
MKTFSLNESLRRDISVTGLETWLTSEIEKSNTELGDTSTRPPWQRRASSNKSFIRHLMINLIDSLEYIWLIYEGFKRGMSLGTLHLIRSSAYQVVDQLWSLSWTAESATDDWKNLVAFYKCLDIKSEMNTPENPEPYISSPAGMKIEARAIRYKYDSKKGEEVLKGASFVINPGEMIAVVG